jgi:hypothetical protein
MKILSSMGWKKVCSTTALHLHLFRSYSDKYNMYITINTKMYKHFYCVALYNDELIKLDRILLLKLIMLYLFQSFLWFSNAIN